MPVLWSSRPPSHQGAEVKAIAFSIVASTCIVMSCMAPSKVDQAVMVVVAGFCLGGLMSTKDHP